MTVPQTPPEPFSYAIPSGVVAPLDAGGNVTGDLVCRKCAYNLRGLNIIGRCPECGTAVGYSAQGDFLRYSDPSWVETLRRGINLILWAIALVVLMVVGSAVLSGSGAGGGLVEVITTATGLLVYVMLVAGSWLLTTPDPSGLGESEYGTARKIIRVTLLIGVASQFLELVGEVLIIPPELRAGFLLLIGITELAGAVGMLAQLQYFAKLAMRIPDPRLSGRATFLKWALGFTYVPLLILGLIVQQRVGAATGGAVAPFACVMGVVGLGFFSFAIMYLLLLEKLGKAFKEQARIARQSWASESAPQAGA